MIKLGIFALAFFIYQLMLVGSSRGRPKNFLPGVKTDPLISVEEYDPAKPRL